MRFSTPLFGQNEQIEVNSVNVLILSEMYSMWFIQRVKLKSLLEKMQIISHFFSYTAEFFKGFILPKLFSALRKCPISPSQQLPKR